MNIDASRKVPFNKLQFLWRAKIIKRHRPSDLITVIPKRGMVLWGDDEMDWPEFLVKFAQFCDEHDAVPF